MESLDKILTSLNKPATKSRESNKKRKWREIEALKERHELKKELEDIDWSSDFAIDELSI